MDDKPIERVLDKLDGVRPGAQPNRWTALCPAHEDTKHSLGVAVGAEDKVVVRCYAGCGFAAIAAALGLAPGDFFRDRKRPRVEIDRGVTVKALAFDKRLPEEALAGFGLSDVRNGSKMEVRIPYRDEAGAVLFERVRTAKSAKAGTRQPPGTALVPYGLWRLPEARKGKRLILVEGESDCWTLWHNGYPALGIPGASAARSLTPDFLRGFEELILWEEPDAAGGHLKADLIKALSASGLAFKVASAKGVKDPCDLHMADPAGFRAAFDAILAAAVPATPAAAAMRAAKYQYSDLANAERFVSRHGENVRHSRVQERWLVWDGVRWRPDDTGEVSRLAFDTVERICEEVARVGADEKQRVIDHWKASQKERAIRSMLNLSQAFPTVAVSPDDIDADPWAFNCPNGTIDLRTGALRGHRRGDLISQLSPVPYDPDAPCPLWEDFLQKVFPVDPRDPGKGGDAALIAYVQKLFGYGLTADTTEQTLPIFWGGGSNGKSVLVETAARVFGEDYWASAPDGMLMVRRGGDSHPTELARLYRKRMLAATETEEGARLNVALVKRLTGGDTITARYMRQDFFEFKPTHKLIMATNDRPRISNGGHGIWRRVSLVPFLVRFWKPELGEVGPESTRADKRLPGKLAGELPGILAWMVRGCLAWQKDGTLGAPDSIRAATTEYRSQQDTIANFVSDRCTVTNEAGARASVKEMYATYVKWCEENGETPFGKIRFNDALEKQQLARQREHATNTDVWVGVRVRAASGPVTKLADLDD